MRRFVYSPDVEAYISTDHGIVDISSDIISGSVTRRLNAASQATLLIQNPYRKYTSRPGGQIGLIKPMDRIIIYLTRVKRMLVFSGYIDQAPIDQLYPEPVTITASCTLKRLLHTYWNPALPYVTQWFASKGYSFDPLTGNLFDLKGKSLWNLDMQNSLGHMMQDVMGAVGGWPIGQNGDRNSVQILQLPQKFITTTSTLLNTALADQKIQEKNTESFLRSLLTAQGIASDPYGSTIGGAGSFPTSDGTTDTNPAPGKLAGKYRATTYGPDVTIAGLAAALQKVTSGTAHELSLSQCQNAATIAALVTQNGFTESAAAGWIAVCYAESSLVADKVQEGFSIGDVDAGYGLFQLTSAGFFGSSGIIAEVVKELTGKSVNVQRGDQYSFSPTYNTLSIMRNASAKDVVNNSSTPYIPIEDLYLRPAGGTGTSSNDYPRSSAIYPYITKAMQQANNAQKIQPGTDGQVGDVKVGSNAFFLSDPTHSGAVGYTFKISPNPYGNDTYIFQAVSVDPSLGENEISIWCPQATAQADNWKDQEISLETSINKANRFPSSTTKKTLSNLSTKAVTVASNQIGTPYAWAGNEPGGFDCSGLVQYAYGKVGITLDHNAQGQYNQTSSASILPSAAEPGDLVFFGQDINSITHVGMVVTPGQMVDAPHSGADVRIEPYPSRIGESWGTELLVAITNPVASSSGNAASSLLGVNSAFTNTGATGIDYSGAYVTQQELVKVTESYGVGLPLVFPMATTAAEAQLFTGKRAYQDDQPLFEFIEFLCTSSGRAFQSLPNGDFFAFYPDYFNWSGQTPYWKISGLETQGLTINVTDDPLATHVYTVADTLAAGQINIIEELSSTVASIEDVGIFSDLINVSPDFDYKAFLERYGARPLNQEVVEIKNSFMQFMYGWMTFLKQWAMLFQANPTFTFMPELWPGGLIMFDTKDLVMYVNSVTHNFDRAGGFTTQAELIAPSMTVAAGGKNLANQNNRGTPGSFDYGMVLSPGKLV